LGAWRREGKVVLIFWVQKCPQLQVLATRFVIDAWSGHYLVKEFFPICRKSLVMVDWAFFVFLLGIPSLVGIASLFAGIDAWWIITGVTWFSSVGLFFLAFAFYAVYYEVSGAVSFVLTHGDFSRYTGSENNADMGCFGTFWESCRRCIMMRQIRRYSGKKRACYIAKSVVERDACAEPSETALEEAVEIIESSYEEKIGWYSKLTTWSFLTDTLHIFRTLDNPRKLYCVYDAEGLRPFITKWVSLQLRRM
jgi:hypothetical protein